MLGETLTGRYYIISFLGAGGYGQTYLAEDRQLPGNPRCVVKLLKPQFNDSVTLETAQRLFNQEAEVLYHLNHPQIPRLLAHFQENQQFYLVQEFIDGDDLRKEFKSGKWWSESEVIDFLQEILGVLEYVHQHNVIHRDIKPANIIRRSSDNKLFLIDFGAVKEIRTLVVNSQGQTSFSIAIGTPGYMPFEQKGGKPRFNSDLYALGMIAIQALTGIHPRELPEDLKTGEVSWRNQVKVSNRLAKVVDKMVRSHFRERYQSAKEVLKDLRPKFNNLQLLKIMPALFVIGTVVIGTAIPKSFSSNNAIAFYQKGERFRELYRNDDALIAYDQAIKNNPNYAEAWRGRCWALTVLGRYEEALAACDEALNINPNYADALANRCAILPAFDRKNEALADCHKAVKIDPDSEIVWLDLGYVLWTLGRFSEALEAYDKALKIKPDWFEAWNGRGWVLTGLKKHKEALAAFEETLKIKPDFASAWNGRGTALSNLQRYEEALRAFEKAIKISPKFADAWNNKGITLERLKRDKDALAAYEKAVNLDRSNNQVIIDNRNNLRKKLAK